MVFSSADDVLLNHTSVLHRCHFNTPAYTPC
jgi:hypothetical protein